LAVVSNFLKITAARQAISQFHPERSRRILYTNQFSATVTRSFDCAQDDNVFAFN